MYHEYPNTDFKVTTLEKMIFAVNQMVSEQIVNQYANTPRMEIIYNQIARTFVAQLRLEIAGEKLGEEKVTYHENWKEAVKDAFIRWLSWPGGGHWPILGDYIKEHHPVRMATTTITTRALYPKISLPRETHYVKVARMDDIDPLASDW